MRGRKSEMSSRMRRGQTIVAERERVESDSERMRARKRLHRKHTMSVVLVLLMLAVLGLLAYMGMKGVFEKRRSGGEDNEIKYVVTAKIVDEDGRGQISARMREYIAQLEQDFRDLGYTVTRVVLPTGTSRELYVDLEGEEMYFKISLDRGSAVSAEDAVRMLKYLKEREIKPAYVDVRVEGKAYYK